MGETLPGLEAKVQEVEVLERVAKGSSWSGLEHPLSLTKGESLRTGGTGFTFEQVKSLIKKRRISGTVHTESGSQQGLALESPFSVPDPRSGVSTIGERRH